MRTRWPAERRKWIQGLVILTLLAWATQTLLSQWGLAEEVKLATLPTASEERFMPGPAVFRSATVELKAEATIVGAEVRLKQIARWSDLDAAILQPSAELVVTRFAKGRRHLTIDIEELKETLEAAGVNLSSLTFCGAMACKLTRSDSPSQADPEREPIPALANASARPTRAPIASILIPPAEQEPGLSAGAGSSRTLRELLVADLVERLAIPAESLQISFSGKDEKLANLREPHFRFDIEPQRLRKLGEITWDVTVTAATGQEKVQVSANVSLWRTELITTRPVAFRQIIHDADLMQRRVLIDRLVDEVPLTKEQAVGQQAARDLAPGTVLTGRMIEAVELARLGQLITVNVELGRVQLTWIGEAREAGALGQTIRVRKPGTREEFSVVLTGPQQARLIGAASGASRAGLAAAR